MMQGFKAGKLPIWQHPIRTRRRLGDIDSLSGTYYTERSTTLNTGDPVPGYPGMIIQDLDPVDSGLSIAWAIQAEGSLDNSLPTKLIARSESRSIGAMFEAFQERSISWQTGRRSCTGVASTDIISTPSPHGLSNGQRLCFLSLSGGAGLTPQSLSTIAVVYYVISATSTAFQVSLESGGSAVDFTTDITDGYFMVADFFPGTPHPLWPNMYLTECRPFDNMTPWRTVDSNYVGKMWDKPYHRVITVSGQQVNSTEKVALSGITGGDDNLRYRSIELPEIVVTDTYVTTDGIPTVSVPSPSAPPNAPSIFPFTISGSDDEIVYQWPSEWTLVAVQHVETINSGIPLTIYSKIYKYKWPQLPK